jgi:hypothetical protein
VAIRTEQLILIAGVCDNSFVICRSIPFAIFAPVAINVVYLECSKILCIATMIAFSAEFYDGFESIVSVVASYATTPLRNKPSGLKLFSTKFAGFYKQRMRNLFSIPVPSFAISRAITC